MDESARESKNDDPESLEGGNNDTNDDSNKDKGDKNIVNNESNKAGKTKSTKASSSSPSKSKESIKESEKQASTSEKMPKPSEDTEMTDSIDQQRLPPGLTENDTIIVDLTKPSPAADSNSRSKLNSKASSPAPFTPEVKRAAKEPPSLFERMRAITQKRMQTEGAPTLSERRKRELEEENAENKDSVSENSDEAEAGNNQEVEKEAEKDNGKEVREVENVEKEKKDQNGDVEMHT